MPLNRKSLVDQVEEVLLADIDRGRWVGLLPGLRELSNTLEVSVPTLSAAIERLVTNGVIVARGGRRRFEVAERRQSRGSNAAKSRQRLLVITSKGGLSVQSKAATDIIHAFGSALVRRGWDMRFAELDFYDALKPHRSWDDLLKGEQVDRILVLFGREAIGRWALGTGLPTCFLGGNAGALPIPVIAVRMHQLVEHALGELLKAGHRRFLVPLCRREAIFVARIRQSYAQALAAQQLPARPEIEVPAADTHSPETLLRLMERAWSQTKPPTALIFSDWRDAVTGIGFLLARGLRVPEDVSVVILSMDHQATWFRPQLAHYAFPEEGFTKALLRWIDGKPHNSDTLLRKMLASFDPGKTIAAPRS